MQYYSFDTTSHQLPGAKQVIRMRSTCGVVAVAQNTGVLHANPYGGVTPRLSQTPRLIAAVRTSGCVHGTRARMRGLGLMSWPTSVNKAIAQMSLRSRDGQTKNMHADVAGGTSNERTARSKLQVCHRWNRRSVDSSRYRSSSGCLT